MYIEHYPNGRNPEDDWKQFKREMKDASITVFWLLILLVALHMLVGCKTVQYVPVETHTTDTLRLNTIQHDSIYMKDSVYVDVRTQNDTVYYTKYKERTKYVERIVNDTTYVATHETIPQAYPVEVKVDKPLHWYQKILIGIGMMVVIALLSYIVYLVLNWMR